MNPNATFTDYTHEFAVWTAARAVARNFTDTTTVRYCIENSSLMHTLKALERVPITENQIDQWHQRIGNELIDLYAIKTLKSDKMSYGRAAKIIAIYCKTALILRNPYTSLAQCIHPPIDRILLQSLHTYIKNPQLKSDLFHVAKTKWTKLDETTYFQIIQALRKIQKTENHEAFWMIEKYWKA